MMTSADPAEDLVPSMRSVQLSEEDKQLMNAFRDKVEVSGQYQGGRSSLYRGGHIPSRLFQALDQSVSGGAPPDSRIGGPGQQRTIVVNMQSGGAQGPAVHPSQQEVPEPKKYTGANIPSRSFRVLQQMTDDYQGAVTSHQQTAAPRRCPSHYTNGAAAAVAARPFTPPPPPLPLSDVEPTCVRLEREAAAAAAAAGVGGRGSGVADHQDRVASGAVLDELRAVSGGLFPRPARPAAVPSRSFRLLQQEYGCDEQEPPAGAGQRRESQEPAGAGAELQPSVGLYGRTPLSKTYRMLQADPVAVPSVLGRNRH